MEEGKTVITVTTEDGSKTATCEVTVSCGHANKTQTDAKDSTCVDKGWDAYYTCDHCGQMFKADGSTQIDAIPYRDLAAHKGGIATCVNKAVCTVCNQAYGDLASHSYTEQDVSAEHLKTTGTCKVEAVYYMSCVVCGSNGTDTFNGAKDSDNHVNTTMINQKEASCEEDGYSGDVKCQDCDTIVANGSTVKATGHTEAAGWTQDETDHWKKCSVCGEICSSKTAHSYDTTTWKTDSTGHWHACICGAKSDFTEHTPDRAEATETDAVKCTDCGYIITPELGHNHKFDKKVVDEKYLKSAADCENAAAYYMSCTCGQASDMLTFVSGDAKGHTVDGNAWKSDADNHWNECACGEKLNSAAHKDANNDNKCDVCAYQLPLATVKPNTNSDNNTSVNAGTAATQPEVVLSPKTGENSFALWCACVAFALGVGIVGVTWYKKQAHS